MCAMTYLHVWHDSFKCAPWLICVCDITLSYVWHDSFICATWQLLRNFDKKYVIFVVVCTQLPSHTWSDKTTCEYLLAHSSHINLVAMHVHNAWNGAILLTRGTPSAPDSRTHARFLSLCLAVCLTVCVCVCVSVCLCLSCLFALSLSLIFSLIAYPWYA